MTGTHRAGRSGMTRPAGHLGLPPLWSLGRWVPDLPRSPTVVQVRSDSATACDSSVPRCIRGPWDPLDHFLCARHRPGLGQASLLSSVVGVRSLTLLVQPSAPPVWAASSGRSASCILQLSSRQFPVDVPAGTRSCGRLSRKSSRCGHPHADHWPDILGSTVVRAAGR